jgi:predicted Rossmann fold flavoprotein
MKVGIIGGGAAGLFASFSVKEHHPDAQVTVFEKSEKLLSKVKISGGGRCNVTHACFKSNQLSKFYPRGEKFLKKAFNVFNTKDTVEWFRDRGVELHTESDNRMFPVTNDSQTIVDCFMREAKMKGVEIVKKAPVVSLVNTNHGVELVLKNSVCQFDYVIIASGGSPKLRGFEWLTNLGHSIVNPLPSLFTFNMPNESVTSLMGLVVANATVRIQASKLSYSGPVLITHWGMSGPAILKLSAWGARYLHDQNYQFKIQVNWLSIKSEVEVLNLLLAKDSSIRKKKICNANPFGLPNRMWVYLLSKVDIDGELPWFELSKKKMNRLINVLLNDVYTVSGKTTFKEEFVTSGGVDLKEVEVSSMQSKVCKNIYFAGEVLNIDGITGGFNFQSAWTTAYIAGKLNP